MTDTNFYPITVGSAEFGSNKIACFRTKVLEFSRLARYEGKEFWFILQGFSGDAGGTVEVGWRLPSLAETKYMFYTALLGRPRGLMYFIWFWSDKVWIKDVLSPMIREFKAIFPERIGYEDASGFKTTGVQLQKLSADLMVLHSEGNQRYLLIVSSKNKYQRGTIHSTPDMIFTMTGTSKIDILLKPYDVQLLDINLKP